MNSVNSMHALLAKHSSESLSSAKTAKCREQSLAAVVWLVMIELVPSQPQPQQITWIPIQLWRSSNGCLDATPERVQT